MYCSEGFLPSLYVQLWEELFRKDLSSSSCTVNADRVCTPCSLCENISCSDVCKLQYSGSAAMLFVSVALTVVSDWILCVWNSAWCFASVWLSWKVVKVLGQFSGVSVSLPLKLKEMMTNILQHLLHIALGLCRFLMLRIKGCDSRVQGGSMSWVEGVTVLSTKPFFGFEASRCKKG